MPEAVQVTAAPTVYSLFRLQAHRFPGALAIEWQGRQWTYSTLLDATDRLATQLRQFGIRVGDRIAILSENRVEYTLLQLAAARIGAIVACLNWRLAGEEIHYCFSVAEPKLLFVSERYHGMASELEADGHVVHRLDTCLDTVSLLRPDREPPVEDPELGLLLLYTSCGNKRSSRRPH